MPSPRFSPLAALQNQKTVQVLRENGVLYVDRGIVAVNKPSGMSAQDTKRDDIGSLKTLFDVLRANLGLPQRPLTVHRLDKRTTGVMIVALTKSDAKQISALFQRTGVESNTLEKHYLALIGLGHVKTLDELQETHLRTIKNSLCNNGDGRMSLWREELQKEWPTKRKKLKAMSECEPLATSPTLPIALVRLKLITGVKHQLRLHMAHALGTPILGDNLHSPTNWPLTSPPIMNAILGEMYLHSHRISLKRSFKQESDQDIVRKLTIQAPLPRSFVRICHEAGIAVPCELVDGSVLLGEEDALSQLSSVDCLESGWSPFPGHGLEGTPL